MKMYKNILAGALAVFFVMACDNDGYIDPITAVDPGPDEAAPTVIISYPVEGTAIRVTEDVVPINIEFEVVDDIEIETISVALDGTEIEAFTEFKDYRHALEEFQYDELTNGAHTLSITATDVSGKSSTKTVNFEKIEPYQPVYDGESFYMPFDGDYMDLVSITEATEVGSPGFSDDAISLKAYAGAADSYLTFPTAGLVGDELSAAFWYNVNATPNRAGILTVSAPDPLKPTTPNNRKYGFRLFREDAGGMQRIKLNVGNGTADNWFDGGAAADLDPAVDEWVHIAFSIGVDHVAVYINGEVVSEGAFTGVDWTGADLLSIASGAPRFTEWGHLSDQSLIDELRFFNKALTQAEVQAIMAGG